MEREMYTKKTEKLEAVLKMLKSETLIQNH